MNYKCVCVCAIEILYSILCERKGVLVPSAAPVDPPMTHVCIRLIGYSFFY